MSYLQAVAAFAICGKETYPVGKMKREVIILNEWLT